MCEILKIIEQYELARTSGEPLRKFIKKNKDNMKRLLLVASLISHVEDNGYVLLSGSYDEGSADYLHSDGIREVTYAFPGGPVGFGPIQLTFEQVEKFKKCLQEEEESDDDSWRYDLDEDEEKALLIYEDGGEPGEWYYYVEDYAIPADDMDDRIRDCIDDTEAETTWDELSIETLEELVTKLEVEIVKMRNLPDYFQLIRESIE